MANKAVKLYRKVKTPDGWNRYSAAMSANGRVKPNALVALRTAQKKANAKVMAEDAGVQVVEDSKRVWRREAAKKFVQAALDRGSNEASELYERTLNRMDAFPRPAI